MYTSFESVDFRQNLISETLALLGMLFFVHPESFTLKRWFVVVSLVDRAIQFESMISIALISRCFALELRRELEQEGGAHTFRIASM